MTPRGYLGRVAVVFGTGWLAVGPISAAGEPGRTSRLQTAKSISGGANPAESSVGSGLPLGDLSNAALVEEYEKAGLALGGTHEVPTDEPFSALLAPSRDPRYGHFLDVRREIFDPECVTDYEVPKSPVFWGFDIAYPGGDYYSAILSGLFVNGDPELIRDYGPRLNNLGLFVDISVGLQYLRRFRELVLTESGFEFRFYAFTLSR